MEEQERIVGEAFERNRHDVLRPCEPGMGVPDAPFRLQAPRPQPCVRKGETRATMVGYRWRLG